MASKLAAVRLNSDHRCIGMVCAAPPAQGVNPPPDGGYPGGNTAEGQSALLSLTTGTYNTGVGFLALTRNNAQFNTAVGAGALLVSTGDENTAVGAGALLSDTIGENNTANGEFTLFSNTIVGNNTATGAFVLFNNTEGNNNTANGSSALHGNTEGSDNTAIGVQALLNNTAGNANTAIGREALANNTSGFANTAAGEGALINNSTGSGNTALGQNAGFNVSTAANVICIGNIGGDNIDNSCFIANIYSNIQPVIGTDPDYVTIASNGKLGRSNLNGSSRRFKHDIQPMDKASEVIFALKPVSFRYNKEYDAIQRPFFGLVAEDVDKVAPGLVGRNTKREPGSVRYEQINAMLLNEFLKEHKKVEKLEAAVAQQRNHFEATIAELKKEIKSLAARCKEEDEQIQNVKAQVKLNGSVSRAVANNP
jgi:hypothetical protein